MDADKKRALLYIVIIFLVNIIFATINVNYFQLLNPRTPLVTAITVSLSAKLLIFIIIYILLGVEGGGLKSLSVSKNPIYKNVLNGIGGGIGLLVAFGIMLFIIPSIVTIEVKTTPFKIGIEEKKFVMAGFYFAAIIQEEILRAFLVTRLTRFGNEWMAILGTAIYFGLVQYYAGMQILFVIPLAFILATYYVVGRSITMPIVAHTVFRWLQIIAF